MARSLTTGMNTAVAAETSAIVHLISITSSASAPNDVVELTTAPYDMSWDSKTWTGIGGALSFDAITESPDRKAQGVRLTLGGVDQSIIALLMSYHMRGRVGVIYLAHLTDGDVVATPYEIFRGYLNDDWKIEEDRGLEDNQPSTCTVSTRIVSRLAALEIKKPVRANLTSHREMLRRSGATGAVLADDFFKFLPELMGEKVYWGTKHNTADGGGGFPWIFDPRGMR